MSSLFFPRRFSMANWVVLAFAVLGASLIAIVYNIIQKHHGSIEVNSKVDKGTEVSIVLPIEHEL